MLEFPPDFTLVIQVASFFVLLVVLNRLLFNPFMELLSERADHTEGASAVAEEVRHEADELARRVDADLAEARAQAQAEADKVRREAREREAQIFERAKNEAGARLAELRRGIEAERDEAARALQRDAEALAREMVDAVLGSAGSA